LGWIITKKEDHTIEILSAFIDSKSENAKMQFIHIVRFIYKYLHSDIKFIVRSEDILMNRILQNLHKREIEYNIEIQKFHLYQPI